MEEADSSTPKGHMYYHAIVPPKVADERWLTFLLRLSKLSSETERNEIHCIMLILSRNLAGHYDSTEGRKLPTRKQIQCWWWSWRTELRNVKACYVASNCVSKLQRSKLTLNFLLGYGCTEVLLIQ